MITLKRVPNLHFGKSKLLKNCFVRHIGSGTLYVRESGSDKSNKAFERFKRHALQACSVFIPSIEKELQ